MGLRDYFKREEDLPVVFTGNTREADLVLVLLESAGFHPYEQAEFSHVHPRAMGSGTLLVPPEELEDARSFLDEVRENAREKSRDWT